MTSVRETFLYGSFEETTDEKKRRLFFNEAKKWANGAIGWVEDQADKLSNIAQGTVNYLKTVSGDIIEVIEEIGTELVNITIAIGDAIYDSLIASIQFIDNLLNGQIEYSKQFGTWIENEGFDYSFSAGTSGKYTPPGVSQYFYIAYKKKKKIVLKVQKDYRKPLYSGNGRSIF